MSPDDGERTGLRGPTAADPSVGDPSMTVPSVGGPDGPAGVRPEAVELVRLRMPLVRPFTTSFGRQTTRDVLLVRLLAEEAEGWGECTAPDAPIYSAEYTDGAAAVLRDHLLPRVLTGGRLSTAGAAERLGGVRGHHMARAAVELAVLDAELRAAGRSAAEVFGATRERVPCGVSVGIPDGGVPELLDEVARFVAEGYVRVKLKIRPGFDVAPVAAVRERWPDLPLQVDANAAYRLDDADHLVQLDAFDLLMVEQPLGVDGLLAHRRLAERLRTPLCLDESLTSARSVAEAVRLGACAVVNVKLGRIGGWLEALAVHDLCRARGVPLWVGGMLETGLGRAANVCLAALPGVTLPGDTSASGRYWERDVTSPFVLEDGHLPVPSGVGFGVLPDRASLRRLAVDRTTIRPGET